MLIAANWKMNPEGVAHARKIFDGIKSTATKIRGVETVVCPPSVFVGDLRSKATGKRLVLGAQDAHPEAHGSYTGEVSALALKSLGLRYVILGHSERRAMGERSDLVARKVEAALRSGLSVIVCVGEKSRDRDGEYLDWVKNELLASIRGVSKKDLERLTIAYEPLWAIGENARRPARAEDVFQMTIFIRKVLSDVYGSSYAKRSRILYGGSVDAENAESFLEEGRVDGLLVGRASRDPKAFAKILEMASNRR